MGRFKVDKKRYDFVHDQTTFEMELGTNDECLTAQMYKLLFKLKMKDELVKNCMKGSANNFQYNIPTDKWENMWVKGLEFMLCYNLKGNFYKMIIY